MSLSTTCIKCGANDWSYPPSKNRACRPCRRTYKRKWRVRTGENRGPKKAAAHRKHLYGLSETEYTQLQEIQKNQCASCKSETQLAVDHDHKTGKVRGLLCSQCNVALGMLQDDSVKIELLLNYIKENL